MREWLGRHWRLALGGVLAFVGGVLVVVSAIRSSNGAADASEVGLWIAIVSIVFQAGSAWLFTSDGRPGGDHAKSSVRRLAYLADRVRRLSQDASFAATASAEERERALLHMSGQLDVLVGNAVQSVEDWTVFSSEADAAARAIPAADAGQIPEAATTDREQESE